MLNRKIIDQLLKYYIIYHQGFHLKSSKFN